MVELLRLRARLVRLAVVADRYGEDLDGFPVGDRRRALPGLPGKRAGNVGELQALALDLHEGLSERGSGGGPPVVPVSAFRRSSTAVAGEALRETSAVESRPSPAGLTVRPGSYRWG